MAKCPNCQQVKVEHQKSGGYTQDMAIPSCKWKDVNMYYMMGFPRTQRQHDLIWVIFDRLTKSAHFIPSRLSILQKIMPRCISMRL